MDEVFKSEISFEHDHIVHKTTQPTEDLILERNKQLRNNEGAIQDLGKGTQSWGRQVASIPLVVWERAKREGFDLNNRDSKIANKELFRFLETPMGKACLVRDKI